MPGLPVFLFNLGKINGHHPFAVFQKVSNMLYRSRRFQAFTLGLAFAGALFSNTPALAVPGLSSSESVKDIVEMIKVYSSRNQRIDVYDLERKLKDRPRAATDALVDLLDTNDEKLQMDTANVLSRLASSSDYSISDDSLKTIIAILNTTESPTVKSALVGVLGNIGPKNQSVKEAILGVINGDFEVSTKRNAISALANLAREEKPEYHIKSTETLIEILKNNDAPALRMAAAEALSRYHNDDELAVPALMEALGDNYLKVRSSAVRALSAYGESSSQSIPVLLKMLSQESDSSIRSSCVYALRNIGSKDDRVVEKFIELIDDPRMTNTVLNYIYTFGDKAAPAVPKLITLLESPDRYKRQYACRALGAIGALAKEAVPALKKVASDSDSTVRSYAATALRQISARNSTGSM